MAIFGNIKVLKNQINDEKFNTAFEYLEKVIDESSKEYNRLKAYELNIFEKIHLDENNFALEQTYTSKDRKYCFFESHKKYIDVQFILEGEEIIEINNINNLKETLTYNSDIDLIKYDDTLDSSILKLKKGDVVIFFPEDAHMPCVKVNASKKIVKTVVKVAV